MIRLSLPALGSYSRVARLAVTGLASRNGFSYDELQDIRIAVGEVFGVLVQPETADARLQFTCWLLPDGLEVAAAREPATAIAGVTDLTDQILAAVVDRADVEVATGSISFTKRFRG